MNKSQSVGVCIITHNARKHLPYCLPPLLRSPLKPKILLMNSSSTDGTVELAKQFGIETHVIPRKEFNHGLTRELGRHLLGTDIVVMITPDAYLENENALEDLIKPIVEGKADLSYGRQLPHKDALYFGSFAREFNYPKDSHIRSLKDIDKWGIYTFFFSDSFAAYKNKCLDEIGGFQDVLTGEDTVALAKLLKLGKNVAYVAESAVYHSHDYSLIQEFKRHFDTGLAREGYKNLLVPGGKDSKRGLAYSKSLFNKLIKEKKLYLIPYAFFHLSSKWLGYQLGKYSINRSDSWKAFFSSQDFYWINKKC